MLEMLFHILEGSTGAHKLQGIWERKYFLGRCSLAVPRETFNASVEGLKFLLTVETEKG